MKGEELGELFILGFRRTCAGSKYLKNALFGCHTVTRMLARIQLVLLQLARVKSLEIRLE